MFCISIGGEKWGKEERYKVGWKEKRETVCGGKEPKEPLESTKEMGQREKRETSQKQGRNQWKRRSEEMNKGEKKEEGQNEK